MSTSAYSFLSWLRRGIASQITASPGSAARAHVSVALTASGTAIAGGATLTAPVQHDVQLYGPGDVVGIDPRTVVRTDPRNWITNFEPNYLVTIEFYDEDFPWRYSPDVVDAATGRLRPWITLVVLAEDEFTDQGTLPGRPLPFIEVGDLATLPPADQLSAWGHVHTNQNVTASDTETDTDDMAAVLPRLAAVIGANPDLACSRLVCPRRLDPQTTYHAFVVPSFETGRLAGLGADPAAAPDGLHSSWGDYPNRPASGDLPYYYRWQFQTSTVGDFEYLVRLLQARGVDSRVGRRDLDVRAPGAGLPGIEDAALGGVLRLGGALKVPDLDLTPDELAEQARYDTWDQPYPHAFQQALAALVNLGDDYAGQGAEAAHAALTAVSGSFAASGLVTATDADPLVTPPLYGRWHALVSRLLSNPDGTAITPADGWVQKLNLSPLYRVPAGTGGRIVRQHDEEYLQAAWNQLGEVLAANRRIRAAQVARELTFAYHSRHLAPLQAVSAGAMLTLSAPLQSRLRTASAAVLLAGPAAGAVAAAPPRTLASVLADSVLARTPLSPAMRRAGRPGSRLMRQLPFGPGAGSGTDPEGPEGPSLVIDPEAPPARQALLERMNSGEVSAAPPKAAPGVVTVDSLEAQLAGPILTVRAGETAQAGETGETGQAALRPALRIPNPVGGLPSSSTFILTSPGDPVPPAGGGTDSADATRFKLALNEVYGAFDAAADAGAAPARAATDLEALGSATMAGLDPDVTVPRRALGGITLPSRFRPPPPEPPRLDVEEPAFATPTLTPAASADPLSEVMAYPVIDQPMFQPLVDASSDLFCPNINLVEPNSITLLETNPPFIESYLMGLNHEMARELLWREYPTDQRGSVFRQFWDPRVVLAGPGESPAAWRERVRDITPIHTWDTATGLGTHPNNPAAAGQELVLVIRGELLKKYPTAVIYANAAAWQPGPDGNPDFTKERVLVEPTPAEEGDPPATKVRMPLYEAKVEPDIYFLGFDLTAAQARGDGTAANPGWFFVIKERPGEPRFGLDLEREGQLQVWNDLAWPDVPTAGTAPGPVYITLDAQTPTLSLSEPTDPDDVTEKGPQYEEDKNLTWNGQINSADVAYILYQAPVLVAVHAEEMLKHAGS